MKSGKKHSEWLYSIQETTLRALKCIDFDSTYVDKTDDLSIGTAKHLKWSCKLKVVLISENYEYSVAGRGGSDAKLNKKKWTHKPC